MKTLLFSYKFLFMTLMSLPLALCSNDNDNETETPFEPVTINLKGLNVALDDTSFVASGYNFNCYRAESSNIGTENESVSLWHPDQDSNPSSLELELNNVTGISKITLNTFNNNGTNTLVSLWNNGTLVEEYNNVTNPINGNFTDTVIITNDREIDLLRITSFEASIRSIKLE